LAHNGSCFTQLFYGKLVTNKNDVGIMGIMGKIGLMVGEWRILNSEIRKRRRPGVRQVCDFGNFGHGVHLFGFIHLNPP
jgi:hypothetical protein